MGYTTEFDGAFTITPPLNKDQVAYIQAFSDKRRMKRSDNMSNSPDPIREKVGLPFGVEGEFYTGSIIECGQDDNVLDFNQEPQTQPGFWCKWTVNDEGTELFWNECEKFYNYADWLEYMVDNFFTKWGCILNGKVNWQGEDDRDNGVIEVNDNTITLHTKHIDLMR